MGYLFNIPAGSNLSNRFKCKEEGKKSVMKECKGRKEGDKGRGKGEGGRGERVKRMGEGLFVHASNSLGVISIACSIIFPFEEEHCNASSQSEDLKGKGSRSLLHDPAIFDFAILKTGNMSSSIFSLIINNALTKINAHGCNSISWSYLW